MLPKVEKADNTETTFIDTETDKTSKSNEEKNIVSEREKNAPSGGEKQKAMEIIVIRDRQVKDFSDDENEVMYHCFTKSRSRERV